MSEVQEKDVNLTERLSKAEEFVNTNRKSLLVIGGAVLAAVLGYLFYEYSYVAGREKEASAQMFPAEEYFRKDSFNLAINGDGNHPGFKDIVDDYGVTPSANLSQFYLGLSYLRSKKYDDAIEALKGYSADDHITSSLSLSCIGDAYMELNNTDEAISYYKRASKEDPNNFTTPIILMKLGNAYETSGKYKEAADAYRKIKKEYSSTTEGQQVEKYIARAEAKAEQSAD